MAIVPHFLLAHFIGDYLLQTNWLAARKGQSLDGLLTHTSIVFVMSVIVVAPYLEALWPVLVALFAIHTAQDALKAWLQPRLRAHLAWSYFADQGGHLGLILLIGLWVGDRVQPSSAEQFSMALGAALIVVTRAYEVSIWANWFSLIVYAQRWQLWGYGERSLILWLGMVGFWPGVLVALPRAWVAWRAGTPLWSHPAHLLEWLSGAALALALGYGLLHPLWLAL